MKRNIKLIIEYDGTNYFGWQIQKNRQTVQGTIRDAILAFTGESVILYGAGRTDAGVHARGQVAHFYTTKKMPDFAFAKALNSILPSDIIIHESKEVSEDFHSQFMAVAKSYSYLILNRKVPPAIDKNFCLWIWYDLDIEKMKLGAQYLLGKNDFSSFESANSPRKSSIRYLNFIDICQTNCYIKIQIEADGFLYHMVRNIVGTLLSVGGNKISPAEVEKILFAKDRKLAGPTVPAKGLCLEYVKYNEALLL